MISDCPSISPGLNPSEPHHEIYNTTLQEMLSGDFKKIATSEGPYDLKAFGKGRIIKAPFTANSFAILGVDRDFSATENKNNPATDSCMESQALKRF